MRYFALGDKATIKISDESLTLEDIRKQAIKTKIVAEQDAHLIREIKRNEFLVPLEEVRYDNIPTWQEIIDDLRINSTEEKPKKRRKKRKASGD